MLLLYYITTIKASLKCVLSENSLAHYLRRIRKSPGIEYDQYPSFCVIRSDHTCFVFTIWNGGHVNIAGIRALHMVRTVPYVINEILHIPICYLKRLTVDNICCAGHIGRPVNLYGLCRDLRSENKRQFFAKFLCKWRNTRFPSMSFRIVKAATVRLFASGAYTIVGGKNLDKIDYVLSEVKVLLCALSVANNTKNGVY